MTSTCFVFALFVNFLASLMMFRELFAVADCDFRPRGYLLEYRGISDDSTEHSDRAGRSHLVSWLTGVGPKKTQNALPSGQ